MDLIFKILWFENDTSAIDSLEPIIQDHLDDLGFKLIKKIIAGMPPDLEKVLKSDYWDLILMDYNLATGSVKGDEIIRKIRDNQFFIDIIFYSEDPRFTNDIMKQQLEGVFICQGRNNLREKVKKIIDLSVKKNRDVCNLRGLIIAEAIDLVKQMDEIILSYMKLTTKKQEFFHEKLFNEEFFTDYHKFRLIIRMLDDITESLKQTASLPENSYKRQDLEKKIAEFSKIRDEFKAYQTEIIQVRNHMAHAKCSVTKKNTLVCKMDKGYRDEEFNEEKCKNIRKNLIKHSRHLESILTKIKEN